MTNHTKLLSSCAAAGLILAAAGPFASAQVYEVVANTAVTLKLPAGDARGGVHVRQGESPWRRLEGVVAGEQLSIELPAAGDSTGRTIIVVNPPPGIAIDDETAPALVAMAVDGTRVPASTAYTHPEEASSPTSFMWEIEDAKNPLDLDSLQVALDGAALPAARVKTDVVAPDRLRVTVEAQNLEYSRHTLTVSVADRAPLRNVVRLSASFETFDPTNVVRREPGVAEVRVDSHFQNYPSVAPLTDGIRHLPGGGAGNDVTWASAENDSAHWVEVVLNAPVEIREVTVYWARVSSASRQIEVQVPAGDKWRTVVGSPEDGLEAQESVTLRFEPVTTDRFRVFQPPNGGSASRPGLMWVNEIEAR